MNKIRELEKIKKIKANKERKMIDRWENREVKKKVKRLKS